MGSAVRSRSVAVRCRSVTKEFGYGETRSQALRDLDIELLTGELTALVGPSGCGKTTLVSIMAGILQPDTGHVEVFGTRLEKLFGSKSAHFRRANVGFIFQNLHLLPALTALENVSVPLLAQHTPSRRAIERALALLEELGLAEHAAKYPPQLSMGQQQRVAIARALVHEPRLVICDEPTAALDAASGLAAMRLLRELAIRPDRAVIVVTHDARVLPFADRIARMNDGRIASVEAGGVA